MATNDTAPVKVTYYLEVISSWCTWVEPVWAELKERYSGVVDFEWKLALMDETGLPVSRTQCEWFYRRSGTIMRSPFMLNSGWFEQGAKQYLAPNLVAEAAKDFGIKDDRARLAIAHAALREGRRVGQWSESVSAAAKACGLDEAALRERAESPEILLRANASTIEFYGLKIDQRPAFRIEDNIGDKAVFSGLVAYAPLAATIDAMLNDTGAYASYRTHHGSPPAS